MREKRDVPIDAAKQLAWPLRLTFAGSLAERLVRAFWPLWAVCLSALAALMLGFQDVLPLEAYGRVGPAGLALLAELAEEARQWGPLQLGRAVGMPARPAGPGVAPHHAWHR